MVPTRAQNDKDVLKFRAFHAVLGSERREAVDEFDEGNELLICHVPELKMSSERLGLAFCRFGLELTDLLLSLCNPISETRTFGILEQVEDVADCSLLAQLDELIQLSPPLGFVSRLSDRGSTSQQAEHITRSASSVGLADRLNHISEKRDRRILLLRKGFLVLKNRGEVRVASLGGDRIVG
ncbi:hypothetical protein D3C72_1025470 [compost metagenome]